MGVAGLLAVGTLQARETAATSAAVSLTQLPAEAREVYRAIHAGGPFAYAKDGLVFGNRERALPGERRGYYREYTVATPGARDRGARRIVCGGRVAVAPVACWYTGDHYNSFQRITP
ncbi:MAG: ribonuclease domain-containing protein [Caldimonas sp.]